MKIYVTRHGETEWNALDKVCGLTDIDLTEKGISQAEELAEIMAEKPIDRIIVSPMKRAVATANILAKPLGLVPEIDDRLIEQNYGIFEGSSRLGEGFLKNKSQFAYKYPGGESMMQVAHRIYSLLDELKQEDKNVLLVCHGGVCRVIRTYFKDMTNEEFFHYRLGNCKLEEYEITGEKK